MAWNKIDIPKREELINLILNGKKNTEIANDYFVSVKTVQRWFKQYRIVKKEIKVV